MSQNLVIVESPAKAKTINKYLGKDYKVLASYGHIRDLPPKDGSVDPDNKFKMLWQLSDRAKKNVTDITKEAKAANTIYLATDPDREGEAISWHLQEVLEEKKVLSGKTVHRVAFNEITKAAVQKAFEKTRKVDQDLVEAYLARRALDYLVGFTISPVLWRKLPGSRSAGRVQSVALRLICEREQEIEKFDPREYWSIHAAFETPRGDEFTARLTHYNGDKLDKFALGNESVSNKALNALRGQSYQVSSIEKKQVKRRPSPPFITSTMQQEASRKLGYSASQTMRMAQQLYEGVDIGGETVGLITYMRTDGTNLSGDAIDAVRSSIKSHYGDKFVPSSPRFYKSKAKNAQEAHEAIRPTDAARTPDQMKRILNDQQWKLYDLIWKRTLACQMTDAVMDQVAVDIRDSSGKHTFRANGQIVAFPGFLSVYEEGRDDVEAKDDDRRLPEIKENEPITEQAINAEQHFTQPPPRYSEASLVKILEEKGIGRPSTYASILQVLQDRDYVKLDKRRFYPEDRGRIVTAFLKKFFTKYVDYDFTAELEDELDLISDGERDWHKSLSEFWTEFKATVDETSDLRIGDVIDYMNDELSDYLFPKREDGSDARSCPKCKTGVLSLKLGKYGGFIGCSHYPECSFTRQLVTAADDQEAVQASVEAQKKIGDEPQHLGEDPDTGRTITLRVGPYGPYVQLDLPEGADKKQKPKRASLPRGMAVEDMTFDKAVDMLRLPREVGEHPDRKELIEAGVGRYGPYLKIAKTFVSLPKGDDVYTVGLNRAVDIIETYFEKKAAKGDAGKKTTTKKKTKSKKPAKKATTKKSAATKKKSA